MMCAHPSCRHDGWCVADHRGEHVQASNKEALLSDLVAIAYPDLGTAREVASNVGEAQKAHLLELDDMVIVERRTDGKVKLHQPSLAGVGAAGGALWGGLVGPLFLPPPVGQGLRAPRGGPARGPRDAGGGGKIIKDPRSKTAAGGAGGVARGP